jgi:hypothetical protein
MTTETQNTVQEVTSDREAMLDALQVFIRQRPGFEWANYGDGPSYRADVRRAGKDLRDAEALLRAVRWRRGCEVDSVAWGRLNWDAGRKSWYYCTGQYFPTEFRAAVCSLLASSLWNYWAENMPKPTFHHNSETGEDVHRYQGLRAGEWIRRQARRELGVTLAKRWFK